MDTPPKAENSGTAISVIDIAAAEVVQKNEVELTGKTNSMLYSIDQLHWDRSPY
jgi:hypothetical protein